MQIHAFQEGQVHSRQDGVMKTALFNQLSSLQFVTLPWESFESSSVSRLISSSEIVDCGLRGWDLRASVEVRWLIWLLGGISVRRLLLLQVNVLI